MSQVSFHSANGKAGHAKVQILRDQLVVLVRNGVDVHVITVIVRACDVPERNIGFIADAGIRFVVRNSTGSKPSPRAASSIRRSMT